MKKRDVMTILIVVGVIILSVIILKSKNSGVSEDIAKCIGEHSELYVQLGCYACEKQKELFGESYAKLNVIDCIFEREKCSEITATPTWIINEEKYVGVQSVEKLRELTGC
jgi:hypothetical protein